jgi:hypothetical protein
VRNPITFSETSASYRLPPPTLDAHGEQIRRWLAVPLPGPLPGPPSEEKAEDE